MYEPPLPPEDEGKGYTGTISTGQVDWKRQAEHWKNEAKKWESIADALMFSFVLLFLMIAIFL